MTMDSIGRTYELRRSARLRMRVGPIAVPYGCRWRRSAVVVGLSEELLTLGAIVA